MTSPIIFKTYKMFISGAYQRSESGRVYQEGACTFPDASVKDLRNAIEAAANPAWSKMSAYGRGQIIYRIAEMISNRREEFTQYLEIDGYSSEGARKEIDLTIDKIIYYAGFTDKYQQLLGSVNPINGPYFSSSNPGPIGVVAIAPSPDTALLGFVSGLLPALVAANTLVVISEDYQAARLSFAEVLGCSDLPAGTINILTTSNRGALLPMIAAHQSVLAADISGVANKKEQQDFISASSGNHKKVLTNNSTKNGLAAIADFSQIKTAWHPQSF